MKNKIMNWHPNGQHHRDPNDEFRASDEYQLVKDGRPYGTIVLTCDGLEIFKPEGENPRNYNTHQQQQQQQHNHHLYAGRNSSNEYTRETDQYNSRDSYAENINSEAEEFIQVEHQKFNFLLNKRTWSSG